ncbi:MAG: hypothetical protein K9K62_07555 [Desulfobacteraceae bacterium]|nr:hypothetical protein [Desulfobacteraceae bacterium]
MTNPCEKCDIEEKVYVCCGRHPETGRRQGLQTGSNRVVMACPFLDADGWCMIYARRPQACRDFFCERFNCSASGFSPGTEHETL